MDWSIHHVALPAHDVRASAVFYSSLLGLIETDLITTTGASRGTFSSDRNAAAIFGAGNRGLHIVRPIPTFARDNGLPLNPTVGGHVAITVPDLALVKTRLDAAEILYADVGEFAMAEMISIYLYDPAMNVVEINQQVAGRG